MTDLLPLTLPALPSRHPDSHKGTYGTVLVVAGSRNYPGAAILTALGAGRGGAGLVALGVPVGILPLLVPAVPFATVVRCPEDEAGGLAGSALGPLLEHAGKAADVVVAGPGLGTGAGAGAVIEGLIDGLAVPLVLDADALNLLALRPGSTDRLAARPGATVLTPHPGEFARLTGRPAPEPDQRAAAAAELARRAGAVVVLKGHRSVVTDGHRAWIETAGNPGMGTGGMGDVLSGVLGALLASLPAAAETAALAVHAHALAGDLAAQELGEESVLPGDVADRLGRVMRSLKGRPAGY